MSKLEKAYQSKVKGMLFSFYSPFMLQTLTDYRFTVRRYIKWRADGKLSALCLLPIPVPAFIYSDLADKLMNEYVDLSKNEDLIREKYRVNELRSLTKRYYIFRAFRMALVSPDLGQETYKELEEVLKKSGIRSDDIDSRLKSEMAAMEVKITDLQKAEPKEVAPRKITRTDFARILSYLGKEGYKIDIDSPMINYIEVLNLHRDYVKQMEKLRKEAPNGGVSNR